MVRRKRLRLGLGRLVRTVVLAVATLVMMASGGALAQDSAACRPEVRQRLGAAGAAGAQNALRLAQGAYRVPGGVLEGCVGDMLRQLKGLRNGFSASISVSGVLDTLLTSLEQQGCALLQQQYARLGAERFDPQAFLSQSLPPGASLIVRPVSGTAATPGWSGGALTVPAVPSLTPSAPQASPPPPQSRPAASGLGGLLGL